MREKTTILLTMQRLPKVFFLLLLILGVALFGKGWHWVKDGFNIQRISYPFDTSSHLDLDEESRLALSQSYHYLGRGHQCYAFESQDGKYVLKLPRYDRYLLPFWLRSCSFPFLKQIREETRSDREHRLRFLLNSFQIAFEELKEETALLYLHLSKGDNLHTKVQLRDQIGRRYVLDLDQTAFLLQRKKPLMMPAFESALREGKKEQAKEILNAFLDIVAIRAAKGIYNKDPSFLRNFAYDRKGIQIDIGSFYRKDSSHGNDFSSSFLETTGHVQRWLETVDPEMASWFEMRSKEMVR